MSTVNASHGRDKSAPKPFDPDTLCPGPLPRLLFAAASPFPRCVVRGGQCCQGRSPVAVVTLPGRMLHRDRVRRVLWTAGELAALVLAAPGGIPRPRVTAGQRGALGRCQGGKARGNTGRPKPERARPPRRRVATPPSHHPRLHHDHSFVPSSDLHRDMPSTTVQY
jgi:hypothetical protein